MTIERINCGSKLEALELSAVGKFVAIVLEGYPVVVSLGEVAKLQAARYPFSFLLPSDGGILSVSFV